MVAPTFQYPVHHAVRRTRMGMLTVREPKWTETVNGGTTFTGKVTVPEDPITIASIRLMTEPYLGSLYVTPGLGRYSFGGPFINREWDSDNNTLTVTAIDWKSWLYRLIVGGSIYGNSPFPRQYTNVDQLTIAAGIIEYSSLEIIASNGGPIIESAPYVSGVNQSYLRTGMDFKTLGAHLDALGSYANGGFEWEVEPYVHSDGLPRPRVQFYIPQRGGVIPGLTFSKTPDGGNILRIETLEEDASNVARRVWAVGEGPNAESTPFAADTDPALNYFSRNYLRTDAVVQFSGAFTLPQMASLARAERLYRAATLGALSFVVRLDAPDFLSYGKGDRCRVIVKDRFLDIDKRNVRILSREIDPDSNTAKITVNLNDLVPPEVDAGGAV